MTERLILVTNDDGYQSPGIKLLASVASHFGKVITIAPDRNRSAISSALSLHKPIRMNEVEAGIFSTDGTPVDCVNLGFFHALDRKPDWVLSGVNHGWNLGEDVFYSGTVAAAIEGCLLGARSAAFSLTSKGDLDNIESFIKSFLSEWENMPLPPHRIWNINFPEHKPKGFRITGQDNRTYHDVVEQRRDPRGRSYYWIGGESAPIYARNTGCDADAVLDQWISVTPLKLDLACEKTLEQKDLLQRQLSRVKPEVE